MGDLGFGWNRSLCSSELRRRHWLACVAGLGWPLGAQAGVPAPLLARSAPPDIDPSGYLVSEKLDGVRALWDGEVLRFRSGRTVAAPAWFLAALPALALDGELWMGRRSFERLSGAVRRQQPDDAEWRQIRYAVFELPTAGGRFAERAQRLASLKGGVIEPVEQRQVPDHKRLKVWLQQVVTAGGEGLMLHRADAPVTSGRSDLLLKLKPQADAEAVVVAHVPGQGRFKGQLGALEVQTPEGLRFKIGSGLSEAQRQHPPAIGATITYRYRDLTAGGVPRFATFLRVADEF